ncbi:TPA: gp53-like domain-containing protein, partial [Yersinia enterocolitica]
DAAKKSIASNAEMQVGTADKLVSLVGLMSVFGKRTFTANDYIRIPDVPGGLIIQFLTKSAAIAGQGLTSYEMTLPVPFPTAILCILSTINGGVGDPASASVSSNKNATNASFIGYVRSTIGGQTVNTGHIAIGY